MNLSQLKDEERLFLSRLEDIFGLSRDKYKTKFTSFLNERQSGIAREFAKQNHFDNYMLYGGRDNAVRLVLGVFPPDGEPNADAFPIARFTSRFIESAPLSHRDFLGSLTALQIARESVGDIMVSPGRCDFFTLIPVSYTIPEELIRVGSFSVKTAAGVPGDFVVSERFEPIRSTIGSARIDSLVSALTNLSREKAARLIAEGRVQRNYTVAENGSRQFQPGDVFSIRGYGKFIVDEIGAPTKKGRLPVVCRKYV